jgi:hypothetical protein
LQYLCFPWTAHPITNGSDSEFSTRAKRPNLGSWNSRGSPWSQWQHPEAIPIVVMIYRIVPIVWFSPSVGRSMELPSCSWWSDEQN